MKNQIFIDFPQAFSDKICEPAKIEPIKLHLKYNKNPIKTSPLNNWNITLKSPPRQI